MRPKTLDSVVGQKRAVEVIKTLIKSSSKTNDPVPHILFNAPPGSGKTTLAKALANDVGSNFYEVNCATISKPKQLFNIIEDMLDRDVLFLDEIHNLTKKTSETLYTILEDFCYYDAGYKNPISKITVIGASTEIGKLPLPLVSRFKFKATLDPYSEQDLMQVCRMVCEEKGFKLNNDIALTIAKTCRGIPRNMVGKAEWLYAYMVGNNIKSIDKSKVLDIIALQGTNKDGLEDYDIQYMKILDENKQGLSLNSMSSKMNMEKDNIQKLIEPYLIKMGFLEISAGTGRKLTRKGKLYVQNL